MNQADLLDRARDHARSILHRCVTADGYRASALPAGYPRCGRATP